MYFELFIILKFTGIREIPPPIKSLAAGDIYEETLLYGYPYQLPTLYPPNIRGHPAFNLPVARGRGGFYRGHQYPSNSRGKHLSRGKQAKLDNAAKFLLFIF